MTADSRESRLRAGSLWDVDDREERIRRSLNGDHGSESGMNMPKGLTNKSEQCILLKARANGVPS